MISYRSVLVEMRKKVALMDGPRMLSSSINSFQANVCTIAERDGKFIGSREGQAKMEVDREKPCELMPYT